MSSALGRHRLSIDAERAFALDECRGSLLLLGARESDRSFHYDTRRTEPTMSHAVAAGRTLDDTVPQRPQHAPPRFAVIRAVLALVWAAALVLAIGDAVPRTDS